MLKLSWGISQALFLSPFPKPPWFLCSSAMMRATSWQRKLLIFSNDFFKSLTNHQHAVNNSAGQDNLWRQIVTSMTYVNFDDILSKSDKVHGKNLIANKES